MVNDNAIGKVSFAKAKRAVEKRWNLKSKSNGDRPKGIYAPGSKEHYNCPQEFKYVPVCELVRT